VTQLLESKKVNSLRYYLLSSSVSTLLFYISLNLSLYDRFNKYYFVSIYSLQAFIAFALFSLLLFHVIYKVTYMFSINIKELGNNIYVLIVFTLGFVFLDLLGHLFEGVA